MREVIEVGFLYILNVIALILLIVCLIEYLSIRKKEKQKLKELDYYIKSFKEKYRLKDYPIR